MSEASIELTASERRDYERNIWLSYAFEFISNVQLWWPIWVIYLQRERGLSLTQITALDAPFFLAQIVAEVPTGAFADRFGRKLSLILGSFTFGAAIFVFGVAENYLVILASYMIWAVSAAFRSGADSAILYDSLKKLGRTEEYAKIQGRSLALMPAATVIGSLLGAPLAAATSLSTPVVLSGGIACLGGFIAMFYREPPYRSSASVGITGTMGTAVRMVMGRATLRYCLVYSTMLGVVAFAPVILLQPFLVGHGASVASLGYLTVPMRIFGAVGMVVAYRVVIGVGQWRTFAMLPLLSMAAYGGLAMWDSFWAFTLFPLISITAAVRQVSTVDYFNQRIPSEQRATILSLRSLALALVLAGGEPALGAMSDAWSLRVAFAATAVFALAGWLLLPGWRRAEAEEDRALEAARQAGDAASGDDRRTV